MKMAGDIIAPETLRLWRIAAQEAQAHPETVDPRLQGEVIEKLLDQAERMARARELMPDVLGLCTLRAMVGNWAGSEEIVLGSGDEVPRQLGRALEALGAALGVEKLVTEAGQAMETLALRDRETPPG